MKKKKENDRYAGVCKVGEKGQIVIPKTVRDMFDINPGDSVIVLCDKKKGIAIMKSEIITDLAESVLGSISSDEE